MAQVAVLAGNLQRLLNYFNTKQEFMSFSTVVYIFAVTGINHDKF